MVRDVFIGTQLCVTKVVRHMERSGVVTIGGERVWHVMLRLFYKRKNLAGGHRAHKPSAGGEGRGDIYL